MEKVNVVQYINEFKNILSYASNIGFFFGAGTSCAFGLPDITTLTNVCKSRLEKSEQKTVEQIEEFVKNVEEKESVTIEDILNHIRQISELTQGKNEYNFHGITGADAMKLDKEICNSIFSIINEKEDSVDISTLRRFMAWYDSANRGFIKEIYTTNYDMLIEMALEANYISYFDGFTGSCEPFFSPESIESFTEESDFTNRWIRLWKVHGSLNWIKKEETANTTERIIRVGKTEKPINELMIYPSKEKYNLSRKEPFIAYFDRMRKYLEKGELVFICSGYSFSDQHINDIIFNAMRKNMRLFVVVFCYSDEQIDEMIPYSATHMNLCVMGPKKAIINGVEKEWEYIEDSATENNFFYDKTKNKFLLGDFKKLIEFLVENSGHKSLIEEISNAK